MDLQALLRKAAENKGQIFPDQDELDEQRWGTYACLETYESSAGESPQTK